MTVESRGTGTADGGPPRPRVVAETVMAATSHQQWGKATVVDASDVAEHVRRIVLEPERLRGAGGAGHALDIGVYVNGGRRAVVLRRRHGAVRHRS